MKYSQLISFNPIEDVIQLITADNKDKAREYVKTYVMSDSMAEAMRAPVLDQLQMDEVIDNKGILIVGNYGTGKSHLMSMLSAVATDSENVHYLQNEKFKQYVQPIAGKFEVLRIEIGGVEMPLYSIIMSYVQEDFIQRGINFSVPEFTGVKDIKKVLSDMMIAFSEKYPEKGYLIVVDEFLSYLSTRDEREIIRDLEFFRALGEMCSKSRLRVIFGMQEKIFDNPRFSFVADTLKHVSDRFTQLIITKEATAYVVSERILKKTAEQKALIREHLEKFSALYTGMSSRMEEFVDLFPIHPSYIDVFNRIYLIEQRHILKNISLTIKDIFNTDVPEDAPGIISFDNYWPAIKSNGLLKSDVTVSRVVNASQQLEDIVNRAFPKKLYKPLAIKIIYALSVHRLTTNGLDVQFGLTAENLKDDLCLYLPMPEENADFLLALVKTTLKDIMTTVSGQFIIYNESNNQYYIDVDKIVDYDEKIRQKASIMADNELNRYFYDVIYYCLDWDANQYVTNFNIYEYDLNWDSHNIFREGYLFMGLPGERSTAQPERDFYIHIMPPYEATETTVENLQDEVYLYFKSSDDFHEMIGLYAAANSLAQISDGKYKEVYSDKSNNFRKKLIKYLSENKNTCFDVLYMKQKRKIIEVLKGRYNQNLTFKDTIDLVSSLCLDDYFNTKYPDFPVMKIKITRRNIAECSRAAFDHFSGRKTQQSTAMLQSFGVLDGDKIRPENSKYASYYINLLKKLPPQGVLNYSDLFERQGLFLQIDKKFRIWNTFTPIIFLSIVYGGYAVITMKDGKTITASNLDQIPKINVKDLYEFKYLSRPAQISMAELKHLFDALELNTALLNNPNDREIAVEQLLAKALEVSNSAVLATSKINNGFELWGEPLVGTINLNRLQKACDSVRSEFSNYSAKFNTPAKLNNFHLSMEQVDELQEQIKLVNVVFQFVEFKNSCGDEVSYIQNIEYIDIGESLSTELEQAKNEFQNARDSIMDGENGTVAAQKVNAALSKVKSKYINLYFDAHKKKRLDVTDAKRKGKIQESIELANLRKLRSIPIISSAKLSDIETELSNLIICYELTPEELKTAPLCKHCGFKLDEKTGNVQGKLDSIEDHIDNLLFEWKETILDMLSDPILADQKAFLSKDQQKIIDNFINDEELPKPVDDFFVNTIISLLKGFEPVVIDVEDLTAKLEQLPPMDETNFKSKIAELIGTYTAGKDPSKIRIIVKRKETEE